MDVEKLLRFCLERLVDNPQAISITRTQESDRIVFEVKVDPSDRSRVIGKEGRTFKALRALINLPLEGNPNDLVIDTTDVNAYINADTFPALYEPFVSTSLPACAVDAGIVS